MGMPHEGSETPREPSEIVADYLRQQPEFEDVTISTRIPGEARWSEEWRVRTVLGGMEQEFLFTEYDTIDPERAAYELAGALQPIVDYARISHRRVAKTDWEDAL